MRDDRGAGHNLEAEEARLQAMRVDAFRAFAVDVQTGGYPQRTHELHVAEEILSGLVSAK